MTAFHEFDAALVVGTPVPLTALRTPANELHVNVWAAGGKGLPTLQIGNFGNVGSVGLTITAAVTSAALKNAPIELVIGDVSGPLVINLTEAGVDAISASGAINLSGIYFF